MYRIQIKNMNFFIILNKEGIKAYPSQYKAFSKSSTSSLLNYLNSTPAKWRPETSKSLLFNCSDMV